MKPAPSSDYRSCAFYIRCLCTRPASISIRTHLDTVRVLGTSTSGTVICSPAGAQGGFITRAPPDSAGCRT
eukprot:scaffold164022_cov30-Prasinocladus_malaysianus.AAC.1